MQPRPSIKFMEECQGYWVYGPIIVNLWAFSWEHAANALTHLTQQTAYSTQLTQQIIRFSKWRLWSDRPTRPLTELRS